MNAEEGKKDDWPETGEKENYKFLYSKERWENLLFGLYSGCTISVAKFSLYFLSSQGFHETKRYRIPLVNTSSSLQHPSQCQPKAFLLVLFILFFFFFLNQEQDLRYVRPCLTQAWRKHCILRPWLPVAVNSCIVSLLSWTQSFKIFFEQPEFLICRHTAVFLGKEKASVLHT